MARVITFSTKFPSHHPLKGQPTDFVGKIWAGLLNIDHDLYSDYLHPDGRPGFCRSADSYLKLFGDKQKHHTIRKGNRWKVGDIFSPRFWGGKPYRSKQVTFAPDIEIKKVWDIEIRIMPYANNEFKVWVDNKHVPWGIVEQIIRNDGLIEDEFVQWFKSHKRKKTIFLGQIICWNKNIEYNFKK